MKQILNQSALNSDLFLSEHFSSPASKEVGFSFCLPKSLSLSEIPGQSTTNLNCCTFAHPLLWLVYWFNGGVVIGGLVIGGLVIGRFVPNPNAPDSTKPLITTPPITNPPITIKPITNAP